MKNEAYTTQHRPLLLVWCVCSQSFCSVCVKEMKQIGYKYILLKKLDHHRYS